MKYLLTILTLLYSTELFQSKTEVEFIISHISNTRGTIRIAVYQSESEYPTKPFKTILVNKKSLQNQTIHHTVHDLSPGNYGFSLLDDENDSGYMDFNRLGFPTEGCAFANNPRIWLKAPPYDKITVLIKEGKNTIHLYIKR